MPHVIFREKFFADVDALWSFKRFLLLPANPTNPNPDRVSYVPDPRRSQSVSASDDLCPFSAQTTSTSARVPDSKHTVCNPIAVGARDLSLNPFAKTSDSSCLAHGLLAFVPIRVAGRGSSIGGPVSTIY
ncbi:hypothetical protein YC2023_009239 [Brassica napus]